MMKVYVILHREIPGVPRNVEGYTPLLVGASDRSTVLRDQYPVDDSGENISQLNDSYCELTGLYWIWKNSDTEIVGLEHYRRYFATIEKGLRFRGEWFCRNAGQVHLLTEEEIRCRLDSCDLLVNQSKVHHLTMGQIMLDYLKPQDLENIEKVLAQGDSRYLECFRAHLAARSYVQCNMFIGRKAIVDRYCEWLFPILEQVDEVHRESAGERYHHREIGYVAEMLFGVWLDVNGIRYESADYVAPGYSAIREFPEFTMDCDSNVFRYRDLPGRVLTMAERLVYVLMKKIGLR